MSILKRGAICLVFVAALLAIARIHLRAQQASDPTQWLDAFNKSLCGRRSFGRPFIMPTFPPTSRRHSNASDYGDYHGNGDDYDYNQENWAGPDWLASGGQSNRVSTGFNAMPGEVPWHAQLTVFFGWLGLYYHALCGGVLIHNNLVLTAAHCLLDDGGWRAQSIWIRLGLYNWHEYEGRQWIGYTKYCLPKDYKQGQFKYDDIAVIKLEVPADYDKHVQPACMAGKVAPSMHENCIGGGMGVFKESDGRTSRQLKVMPISWCGIRQTFDYPADQSCWVTSDENRYPGSMCKGDSGSGVYCANETNPSIYAQYTSLGVLSNTQIGPCDEGKIHYSFYSDFGILHDRIMELVRDCSD